MYHETKTVLTACMLSVASFCIVIIGSLAPILHALIFATFVTSLSIYGVQELWKSY